MQCLRCGCEEFNVPKKVQNRTPEGKHSLRHDTRYYVCEECGLTFKVGCEVELVSVYDGTLVKQRWVTVGEFQHEWLPLQNIQNPNTQTNLFDN